MVVEREVVRRQDVGTERLLPRPVGDAQAGGGGLQVGERGFAGPEGFKREFELAAGVDAGKTEGGRAGSHLLHHLAGARAMVRRTGTVIRPPKAKIGSAHGRTPSTNTP